MKKLIITTLLFIVSALFLGTRDLSIHWVIAKIWDQGASYWIDLDSYEGGEIPTWLKLGLKNEYRSLKTKVEVLEDIDGLTINKHSVFHPKSKTPVEELYIVKAPRKSFSLNFHVAPEANRDIDEWRDFLDVPVVINGSYYGKSGYPITPIRLNDRNYGPNHSRYKADHGAIVLRKEKVDVIDFSAKEMSLSKLIDSSDNYMVSYPLLVNKKGEVPKTSKDHWLANRTFIALTKDDHILMGVTKYAFFSLVGLGNYLTNSELNIKIALNLDGGPVSGMAIEVGSYRKTIYGLWELAGEKGSPTLLRPGNNGKKWPLPITVSLTRKDKK